MGRHSICLYLSVLLTCCHGYRFFQDRIPNGANVPHPCRVGDTWMGVGHENEQGGGVRNAFGLDFHANGKKWDRTLCLKDSDGDGLSNGEELGDPDCLWEVGKEPTRTTELSHPGVCDPWNSPECETKTTFVSCGPNKLVCPAMHEDGVAKVTIRLPADTPVPAKGTIYECMVFDYPQDADYHLIAHEPLIDNVNVMHHILLIGCDDTDTQHPPGVPYECGMEVDDKCRAVIGIWSFGMLGECAHRDMGFRIGNKGYKRGVMQFHWNNPEERADYTDSSGMIIYLTKNLRPYDAGILTVGQEHILIPPGEDNVRYTGVCSSECSNWLIKDEVKVPVAFNHMHGLGKSQKVELIRDGRKLFDLTDDPKYDYNTPELHIYDTPLTLKPGDEINTECNFNSMSRTTTTFFGDGTYDEMCYGFITYYPKENIPVPFCTAWKDVTKCAFNISDVIHGCNFNDLHDLSKPSMKKTFDVVMENCSPHIGCRKECLPVVKRLKQTSCYRKGTVDEWARLNIEKESPDVLAMMKFYAALDSCDRELTLEEDRPEPQKCPSVIKIETSSENKGMKIAITPLSAAILCCLTLLLL